MKTGTSKDMRDNWAMGWSSRYTVGVWVGNASGAPMHEVSGTSPGGAHLGRTHGATAPAAPAAPGGACSAGAPGGARWPRAGTGPAGGRAHRVVCGGHAAALFAINSI